MYRGWFDKTTDHSLLKRLFATVILSLEIFALDSTAKIKYTYKITDTNNQSILAYNAWIEKSSTSAQRCQLADATARCARGGDELSLRGEEIY